MNTVAYVVYFYLLLVGGGYALWLVCNHCRQTSPADDRQSRRPASASKSSRVEKAVEILVAVVFLVSASATLIAIGQRSSPDVAREPSAGRQASVRIPGMQAVPSGRLHYAKERQGCPLIGADLSGLPVSDDDIVAMVQHSEDLEWLILNRTIVSDECLLAIAQLPRLNNLSLANTKISDTGLVHLTGLQELEDLSLDGTSINDPGLVHVSQLRSLQFLSIWHTGVTDVGLEALSSLCELRKLYVFDTKVTPGGVAQLKEQLPCLTCYGEGSD